MFQPKSVSLIQPGFCLYEWNIGNVNVIRVPSLLMSIYDHEKFEHVISHLSVVLIILSSLENSAWLIWHDWFHM